MDDLGVYTFILGNPHIAHLSVNHHGPGAAMKKHSILSAGSQCNECVHFLLLKHADIRNPGIIGSSANRNLRFTVTIGSWGRDSTISYNFMNKTSF